jgi:arginase family enzyme
VNDKWILNPYARAAAYGGGHFAYDLRVVGVPLVEIPTEPIDEDGFAAFELLRTRGFLMEPRTGVELEDYVTANGLDRAILADLTDRRLLMRHREPAEEIERKVLDHFNRRYLGAAAGEPEADGAFDDPSGIADFFYVRNTFFNLPTEVRPDRCQVGLLGFPHSSVNASFGTEAGPDQVRLQSRSLSWLEIQKHGVYSEVGLDQGRPDVICRDVVVRDCGDLRCDGLTVLEMIERVGDVLATEFFAHRTYPLIIGGDHAVTYPIVRTCLERTPDLGLIHLDAHNDLFYTPHVVHSHAAPVSNLLRRTKIERIASFGLRTFTDTRMAGFRSIYDRADADSRLSLRSVTATKQLIMDRSQLDEELRGLAGRPYYVSLDLDVLSEAAIGRQVSTPFGVGLEWHELLTFIVAVFRNLDVVGFDIVEFNGLNGDGRERTRYYLNSLLLLVIDGLARANARLRGAGPAAAPLGPAPSGTTDGPDR